MDTNIFNIKPVEIPRENGQESMIIVPELLDAIRNHPQFNQQLTSVGLVECGGIKLEKSKAPDLKKLTDKLSCIDDKFLKNSLVNRILKKYFAFQSKGIISLITKYAGIEVLIYNSAADLKGDLASEWSLTHLLLTSRGEKRHLVSQLGRDDLVELVNSINNECLAWTCNKDAEFARLQKSNLISDDFTVGKLGLGDMLYLFNALLYDVPLITANSAMVDQIKRNPVARYLFSNASVTIIVPEGLKISQLHNLRKNANQLTNYVRIMLDKVADKVKAHYVSSEKSKQRASIRKTILNDLLNILKRSRNVMRGPVVSTAAISIQAAAVDSVDICGELIETLKSMHQIRSLLPAYPDASGSAAEVKMRDEQMTILSTSGVVHAARAACAASGASACATCAARVATSAISLATQGAAPVSVVEADGDDIDPVDRMKDALAQTVAAISKGNALPAGTAASSVTTSFADVVNKAIQLQVRMPAVGKPLLWQHSRCSDDLTTPAVLRSQPSKLALIRAHSG